MNYSAKYLQEAFGIIIVKRIHDKIDRSLTELKNRARRYEISNKHLYTMRAAIDYHKYLNHPLIIQFHNHIVRELMGETLPPPLGNFGDLYFQKPYTLSCSDQLVCTYIAGTLVWTLAILWDTPNLLCWSSDQQVQLPNTFQKHRIPILGKKIKKRLKDALFLQFF